MSDMADEPSGVDVTLIDALLALTPTERIRRHDEALAQVRALQDAFARREERKQEAGCDSSTR